MRHLVTATIAASLWCWTGFAQAAEPPTVENTPPVVVKTDPQAGQIDVEPGRRDISVTFSKPMRAGSWSWVELSKESFPTKTGEPHFLADQRTSVLPVQLEPGKTYAIGLNSPPYQNFRDQAGRPALPYLLVFRTK
jgi:Big-like domain-containing protein